MRCGKWNRKKCARVAEMVRDDVKQLQITIDSEVSGERYKKNDCSIEKAGESIIIADWGKRCYGRCLERGRLP